MYYLVSWCLGTNRIYFQFSQHSLRFSFYILCYPYKYDKVIHDFLKWKRSLCGASLERPTNSLFNHIITFNIDHVCRVSDILYFCKYIN